MPSLLILKTVQGNVLFTDLNCVRNIFQKYYRTAANSQITMAKSRSDTRFTVKRNKYWSQGDSTF